MNFQLFAIHSIHALESFLHSSSQQRLHAIRAEFADNSDVQSRLFGIRTGRVFIVDNRFPLNYCSHFCNFYNEEKNEQPNIEGSDKEEEEAVRRRWYFRRNSKSSSDCW